LAGHQSSTHKAHMGDHKQHYIAHIGNRLLMMMCSVVQPLRESI